MTSVSLDFLDNLNTRFNPSAISSNVVGQFELNPSTFQLPRGVQSLGLARVKKDKETEKKQLQAQAQNPLGFGAERFTHPMHPGIKMSHGTTTLGFIFDGGVCLAVDSRASMGSYIGSGTVKKVLVISQFLLGTMAGGAADCSFWERQLAYQAKLYELREGKRISVAAASKLLANNVYQYKDMGLSMGTMIAGWDINNTPALYYVDDDGTRVKGERFSVGSGSTYAYGVLDNEYRRNLTTEEAVELGKRAIYHATHRDAYSGSIINVFVINANGWKQYFSGDMNELHYGQYAEERRKRDAEEAKS